MDGPYWDAFRFIKRPKIVILDHRLDIPTRPKPFFLYHEQSAV
jgi:hypothetical protein